MAFDFAKLTADVEAALKAGADAASATTDGGSCNLDGVVLRLPRIHEESVVRALSNAGISTRKSNCGYHGIGYMINPTSGGQANQRYVACIAIEKHLQEAGYNVSHFYMAD